jgi:hypothetical protein
MPFPLVSRERYEERCKEVAELKAERQQLLDRVAMMSGQPAIYAPAAPRPEAPPAHVGTYPEAPAARPTLEQITRQANLAAQQMAKTPGMSIVRSIREELLKGVNPIAS